MTAPRVTLEAFEKAKQLKDSESLLTLGEFLSHLAGEEVTDKFELELPNGMVVNTSLDQIAASMLGWFKATGKDIPTECEYYSPQQFADELGISLSTFNRYKSIDPDFPKPHKFGPPAKNQRIRWTTDQVQQYKAILQSRGSH